MMEAKWWSPKTEESVMPSVGGTGSISTFSGDEKAERPERDIAFGFAPAPTPPAPEQWGEAAWTAKDIL